MSSGFVSEKALEEKRERRQAEWDAVRKPDDPETAPEEPEGCSKSLFDQLEANRAKAKEEFEATHSLKNQIRGLDDEEATFLDEVDEARSKVEAQRRLQDRREVEELRRRQAEQALEAQRVPPIEQPLKANVSRTTQIQNSQSKLLLGAVKRKSEALKDSKEEPKEKKSSLLGLDYQSSSSSDEAEGK